MNGTTPYEGRVEICYDGVWGSVCDSGWDYWDAAIVCLQMGFQGASMFYRVLMVSSYIAGSQLIIIYMSAHRVDATAITNSFFGDGTGPYHLSSVYCRGIGGERTLLDCSYTDQSIISSSRCTPGNDAGVRCDGKSHCNIIIIMHLSHI